MLIGALVTATMHQRSFGLHFILMIVINCICNKNQTEVPSQIYVTPSNHF